MRDFTAEDKKKLRHIMRRSHVAQSSVRRARIVLTYIRIGSINGTAAQLGCCKKVVRRWVDRWDEMPTLSSLCDRKRSGRRPSFGIVATAYVLSLVSQPPSEAMVLTASWTQADLAKVLCRRGLTISRSSVQRILARQDIDVRRVRYYLFTQKNRAEYVERRDAICRLYLSIPELPDDEIVVCFDAKPGIQILGDPKNKGGSAPPSPGKTRLIEFEYRRMGTRSLVAATLPATGEVVHYELYDKERRFDSAETIAFLERLRLKLTKQGYKKIHLVLDNGSTHRSKATTAFFKAQEGVFETYFTPVHASWLNLCENFFSVFSRRYLRNRRYNSVQEFTTAVPLWMTDHNMRCKPLRWTYAPHQQQDIT